MTLIRYQCDRCGNTFDKIKDVNSLEVTHVESVSPLAVPETVFKKDLCDECLRQLVEEWVEA